MDKLTIVKQTLGLVDGDAFVSDERLLELLLECVAIVKERIRETNRVVTQYGRRLWDSSND